MNSALISACVFSLLSTVLTASPVPDADAAALLAIKAAFSSSAATKLGTWATGRDCSAWAGIKCDKTTKRVISLVLPNRNLGGNLSSAIGDLTALTKLDLSGNLIGGEVPSSIAKLTQLQNASLAYNYFIGGIPSGFQSLPKLIDLRLNNNGFTGTALKLFVSPDIYNVDFSFNYIGGDASIKKNIKKLCRVINATRGMKFFYNCMRFQSRTQPCFAYQRGSGTCRNFCNAQYYFGACGGKGLCQRNATTGGRYCECFSPYKLSSSNKFLCQ